MDARCSSLTVPRTETFAFLFDVLWRDAFVEIVLPQNTSRGFIQTP